MSTTEIITQTEARKLAAQLREQTGVAHVAHTAPKGCWGGRFDCPVDWATRADAQAALNRIRAKADKIASQGYYQPKPGDPGNIFIKIDGERIDLVMPFDFTPSIRRQVIHLAAMQHYLDLEVGS